MNKPQPKAEIVIGYKGATAGGGMLHIYAASQDAYTWIVTEGQQFGKLYKPDDCDRHFTLFIDPFYNTDEVEQYLLSYLEGQS